VAENQRFNLLQNEKAKQTKTNNSGSYTAPQLELIDLTVEMNYMDTTVPISPTQGGYDDGSDTGGQY